MAHLHHTHPRRPPRIAGTAARIGTRIVAAAALLAAGAAQAALVGVGTSNDSGGTFTVTGSTPPFTISNPAGSVEHRGAVEFDLRSLGGEALASATFTVRGTIETDKHLTLYAYIGDGNVTANDFVSDHFLVGTASLAASLGQVSEVVFDLAGLLDNLDGETPDFLGFNLRESESPGGIVALEYLLLGTLATQQQITQTQPGTPVPAPSTALLLLAALGSAACTRRRSGVGRAA